VERKVSVLQGLRSTWVCRSGLIHFSKTRLEILFKCHYGILDSPDTDVFFMRDQNGENQCAISGPVLRISHKPFIFNIIGLIVDRTGFAANFQPGNDFIPAISAKCAP